MSQPAFVATGRAPLGQRVVALLFNAMVLFARLEARVLPASWLHAMGDWSARLIVRFAPGVRRALLDNARHLLGPGATLEQRRRNAVGVLESFGRFFVELLLADQRLPTTASLQELARGLEYAELARARSDGRGVVCVTLHMGNYELGPLLLPELVEPVAVVYNRDPWGLFESLRSSRRRARRVTEIPVDGSPLFGVECLNVLRAGGVVAAAADAGFDHQRGRAYGFLGGRARFLDWPARLAWRSGAPLLPCFTVRDPETGGYRFELAPALYPDEHHGPEAMMNGLLDVFEDVVQRYPDQWLILHRYWLDPMEMEATRDRVPA